MKFCGLAALFPILLTLSQAWAFPLASPDSPSCDRSSYDQSMRDLFIKVNQVGKVEKRRYLSKLKGLEAAGFTKEDIQRVRTCSGIVFCPASGPDSSHYVTAFSLVSPDQVFIPAHLFFNEDAKGHPTTIRSNLDNCYFHNYTHPDDRIPLKMGPSEKERLRSLHLGSKYFSDLREDGLKVSLANSIPGCRPFGVDRSDQPMEAGDRVLSIGVPTPDIIPRITKFEPVGQFCRIREPITFSAGPSYYISDCSSSPGESGSIQFRRTEVMEDGQTHYKWVAMAMQVRTGNSGLNGDDFNLATGSGTDSVGIEDGFLRDLLGEHNAVPIEHTVMTKEIGI